MNQSLRPKKRSKAKLINQRASLIADEVVAENNAIMMYQPFLTGGNEPSRLKSEIS